MNRLNKTRLLTPLFALLFILVSLCSYQLSYSQSGNLYHRCDQYQPLIDKAVKKHFPKDFQNPNALTAQYYQESLCDPEAKSYVGASGIAQFMPRTALEMGKIFGTKFDPTSLKAIEYGAYYQNRQMNVWRRRNRTKFEMWQLGLAGYNAGTHNILKAQKACDGARLWDDIKACLPQITGRHHKETWGYVDRIETHWEKLDARSGQNSCQASIEGKMKWW